MSIAKDHSRVNRQRQTRDYGPRTRKGSILILVIAVLVLLMLIGVAYLSSTQSETETAKLDTNNKQADLYLQGMMDSVQSAIAQGVTGPTPNGPGYRPVTQEMPEPAATYLPESPIAYHHYTHGSTDLFLAERIPTAYDGRISTNSALATAVALTGSPAWSNLSWPLNTGSSSGITTESPFSSPVAMYLAANKGKIVGLPTSKTVNGTVVPAMWLIVPAAPANTPPTSAAAWLQQINHAGAYDVNLGDIQIPLQPGNLGIILTPSGPQYLTVGSFTAANAIPAADSDGDGIADSLLFKLGVHNGVTYYAAYRVIDGNSAVNVSSAWTNQTDQGALPTGPAPAQTVFGFFRSNVGLQEMLANPLTPSREINALNWYRATGFRYNPTDVQTVTGPWSTMPTPIPDVPPINDPFYGYTPVNNFSWWSLGDMLDHQMTSRPGNPGLSLGGGGATPVPFHWIGRSETMKMASRFVLANPSAPDGLIEQFFPTETKSGSVRSSPYSPADVGAWFKEAFAFQSSGELNYDPTKPLRSVLVGDNAVSNAVPGRYVYSSNNPSNQWNANVYYNFGDMVIDTTTGTGQAFICIVDHSGGSPPAMPGGDGYKHWTRFEPTHDYNTNGGVPWTTLPVKTCINTAPFEQLWMAYWAAMCDSPGQPPYLWQKPAVGEVQARPFRNVMRDPAAVPVAGGLLDASKRVLSPRQMVILRAAVAAVQAENMRSGDEDIISRRIHLPTKIATNDPDVDVEVFGTKRQPYITEVFAQIDPNSVPDNYMAIELVNPYTDKDIDMTNWVLCTVDRSQFATASMKLTPVALDPGQTLIIPRAVSAAQPGIAVIASKRTPVPDKVTDVTSLSAFASPHQNFVTAAGLIDAVGKELVLVRPRRGDFKLSKSLDATDPFVEDLANPNDMVPVDQIDLTNADKQSATQYRLFYRRAGNPVGSSGWNFVYPGPYRLPVSGSPTAATDLRHAFYVEQKPATGDYLNKDHLGQLDDGGTTPPPAMPGQPAINTTTTGQVSNPLGATYMTVPLQIGMLNSMTNAGMAGPNPAATLGIAPYGTNFYPFGGFARNGDIMQVPFIGSYRVIDHVELLAPGAKITPTTSATFWELNSVTMDAALAQDDSITLSIPAQDAILYPQAADNAAGGYTEQIGRFCPVGDPTTGTYDFGTDVSKWHYHWTSRLFDYLTVQSPQDDYYPDYNPAPRPNIVAIDGTPNTGGTFRYPSGNAAAGPKPVSNYDGITYNNFTAGQSEDTVGVEGLININTAPFVVLRTLPFYGGSGSSNEQLAAAIVRYRQQVGPFKTIYDLYRVPEFKNANNALLTSDPGPAQGDFSPSGIGNPSTQGDGVRYDFKERFLLLNHISNLITTRSDTFTAYVIVQGWRGVDTGNPVKVEERRATFLIDRNNVTPTNTKPLVVRVPNQ